MPDKHVCANRIFVQDGVYDEFATRYAQAVGALSVGAGLTGADIGPLINRAALDKVEMLVADAVDHGATMAIGADATHWAAHFTSRQC